MIVELPDTDAGTVARRLVDLRETGGAVALGRVLNLIIVTDPDATEQAIQAANVASMEHPCRVIVLSMPHPDTPGAEADAQPLPPSPAPGAPAATAGPVAERELSFLLSGGGPASATGADIGGWGRGPEEPESRDPRWRLDAEIRVGADAGASEVVLLRPAARLAQAGDSLLAPLLLSDSPVVVWWPGEPVADPSADPVGAMATRRITDCRAARDPQRSIRVLAHTYKAGDTDLVWTRITLWRALLAASLDPVGSPQIRRAVVTCRADHPSGDLLATWLGLRLECPAHVHKVEDVEAITRVELEYDGGAIVIDRPEGADRATVCQSGMPTKHVPLAMRTLHDCLAEELRRLDPDDVYGEVLRALR